MSPKAIPTVWITDELEDDPMALAYFVSSELDKLGAFVLRREPRSEALAENADDE
jgi:hypothetical protein